MSQCLENVTYLVTQKNKINWEITITILSSIIISRFSTLNLGQWFLVYTKMCKKKIGRSSSLFTYLLFKRRYFIAFNLFRI